MNTQTADRTRTYSSPDVGRPVAPQGESQAGPSPMPGPSSTPRPSSSSEAPSPADALRTALARLGELQNYAVYFVSTKVDGLKVTARNLAIYAILGLLGAVVGATVLIVSVVLLLQGIAGGLAHLFGPRFGWLGGVLVGLLVLGGVALGVILGLKFLTRTSHAQLVKKYESRQREQRDQFGHDVEQRARSNAR